MRNYKITLEYDGSRYQGWQRQKLTTMTIQEIIEQAISEVTAYPVEIKGSGRTDAGVHAKGQTASLRLSGKVSEESFVQAVNEKLPEDIRIKGAELVKGSFHARHSAVGKCYSYCIDIREKADVFSRRYTYHHAQKLDMERMQKAATYLEGTFDYLAFTDKKEEKSAVRTINKIQICRKEDKITLLYFGSGFLYHMVRILTGTLIQVGEGEKSPEEILGILASKERAQAGFLAPAQGLCLEEVYY